MENNLFITYSLIKTLYEKKRDYIDTFCVFVIKVIKDKKKVILQDLQQSILEEYKLLIPENTLKTILIRAKKRNFINKDSKLTEEGVHYIEQIEDVRNVERKISELINDLRIFLNKKDLSDNNVYIIFRDFINKNISSILEFCLSYNKISSELLIKKKITEYDQKIINYLNICNSRKPEIWKTIENIIFGSILFVSPCIIDINIAEKKFKSTYIFMDSNFIFSILDLHRPEFCKPSKELFSLLIKFNFKLRIFDFTLEEIIRVLNRAITERKKYIKDVEVNSIYSVIVDKGWSDIDIRNKIRDIRKELQEMNIDIEFTNINIKEYSPDDKYISILRKYKDISSSYKINHDIAAIEQIKKIRKHERTKLEETVALFLTSDQKLSKANYEEMSHKENGTIAEVIPEILLTNILWLKDPLSFKDIPLCAVIAANSNDIFIDKRVWERFYLNLVKLKQEKKITDLDISILFYDDYFKNKLLELGEVEIEKNTEDFILNELSSAKVRIDTNMQQKIESQRKIYELNISKKDEEISELIEVREKEKLKVLEECNKSAIKHARCIFICVGIFIIILVISIYYLSRIFNFNNELIFFATFLALVPLFGFKFNVLDLKQKLINKTRENMYKKVVKKYYLDDTL